MQTLTSRQSAHAYAEMQAHKFNSIPLKLGASPLKSVKSKAELVHPIGK